jgi:hypothetical protein
MTERRTGVAAQNHGLPLAINQMNCRDSRMTKERTLQHLSNKDIKKTGIL